jgi:hypothetical protein
VYWATGGLNYVVPVALGLAWLEVGRRLLASDQRWRPLRTISWTLAGLALGTAHEQASAAVIMAGAAVVGLSVLGAHRWQWRHTFFCAGLAAFTAGTLVLVVAPGNRLRAASIGQTPVLEPAALVANYGHVLQGMLHLLLLSVGLGVLAGLLLGLIRMADSRTWALHGSPLLFGALAAVAPLAPLPDFAADRTAFAPGVYLFGAALALTAAAAAQCRPSTRITVGLSAALVSIFLVQAVPFVVQAATFQAAYADRMNRMKHGTAEGVILPALEVEQPDVLLTDFLSTNPTSPVNVYVARYYGVASVQVTRGETAAAA